jgi:hypothetical protein
VVVRGNLGGMARETTEKAWDQLTTRIPKEFHDRLKLYRSGPRHVAHGLRDRGAEGEPGATGPAVGAIGALEPHLFDPVYAVVAGAVSMLSQRRAALT